MGDDEFNKTLRAAIRWRNRSPGCSVTAHHYAKERGVRMGPMLELATALSRLEPHEIAALRSNGLSVRGIRNYRRPTVDTPSLFAPERPPVSGTQPAVPSQAERGTLRELLSDAKQLRREATAALRNVDMTVTERDVWLLRADDAKRLEAEAWDALRDKLRADLAGARAPRG